MDHKFPRTKVSGNESLHRVKIPWSDSSTVGTVCRKCNGLQRRQCVSSQSLCSCMPFNCRYLLPTS